jgi:hypothetical protein
MTVIEESVPDSFIAGIDVSEAAEEIAEDIAFVSDAAAVPKTDAEPTELLPNVDMPKVDVEDILTNVLKFGFGAFAAAKGFYEENQEDIKATAKKAADAVVDFDKKNNVLATAKAVAASAVEEVQKAEMPKMKMPEMPKKKPPTAAAAKKKKKSAPKAKAAAKKPMAAAKKPPAAKYKKPTKASPKGKAKKAIEKKAPAKKQFGLF